MKKILMVIIVWLIILPQTCLAGERPLGEFSREEAINKLFTDRTLDPIEGIWFTQVYQNAGESKEILIVKTALLNIQDPSDKDFDYTVIFTGETVGMGREAKYEVGARISKTKYPHIFQGKTKYGKKTAFLIINPTSLANPNQYGTYIYVRTYPLQ